MSQKVIFLSKIAFLHVHHQQVLNAAVKDYFMLRHSSSRSVKAWVRGDASSVNTVLSRLKVAVGCFCFSPESIPNRKRPCARRVDKSTMPICKILILKGKKAIFTA